MKKRTGITLVELLISMALITVGIAGLVQSFGFIQKAVQSSKNRTLASNLAQEKMQILKQKSYYQLLVTTAPAHDAISFAPESVDYDAGYFPPEQIIEGGVPYTRYTYVQGIRENSGELNTLAPGIPDTGMKRITITVVWGQGDGKRKITLRSIMANPETVMSYVIFNGTVKSTSSVPLGGALVSIVEGAGWADTTDPLGQYNIDATPGTFSLMVSATGYYSTLKSVNIAAGDTQTNNFLLTKIESGTVKGYPWLRDHLVISQVVGSTVDATGFPAYDQEYVEVFNPTTYTWTLNGAVGLKFQRASDSVKKTISLDYINSEIESGGYFLFANTGTVMAAGMDVDADAVWSSTSNAVSDFPHFAEQENIIPVDEDGGGEGSGALELYRISDGAAIDRVGWNKTGYPAPFYEGQAIVQTIGLSRNELYARFTSTSDTSGINWTYGPAYDSGNNSVDFHDYSSAISAPPHSANSENKEVISGTPAVGTVVSCFDALSASTEAVLAGNPPYAFFSLVDVATGTWTVILSSGLVSLEQSTVTLASAGAEYVFPSSTTVLTQVNSLGIITGRVLTALGIPLGGVTIVSPGNLPANTDSNGRYRLNVLPGIVDVTANPEGTGISSYVTASSVSISVSAGMVHSGVDFVLYQGGRISGFITRDAINGLPGVAVALLDESGNARDQQVSGTDGRFTSVILSTGLYTVKPSLGKLDESDPVFSTVTVTMGNTVAAPTFTISGALGYITGKVSALGQPIKSGVLIVASTMVFAGSPPVLPDVSSTTAIGAPLYMVSSKEDGSFVVEARQSTTSLYNVYAYYPTPSGTTVVVVSSVIPNIPVISGQTYSGVNFSW